MAARPRAAELSRGCCRALTRWAPTAKCHLLPRKEKSNRSLSASPGHLRGGWSLGTLFEVLRKASAPKLALCGCGQEGSILLPGLLPGRGGRKSSARCRRGAGQGATNWGDTPPAHPPCPTSQPVVCCRFRGLRGQQEAENLDSVLSFFFLIFFSFLIKKKKGAHPNPIASHQNQMSHGKCP